LSCEWWCRVKDAQKESPSSFIGQIIPTGGFDIHLHQHWKMEEILDIIWFSFLFGFQNRSIIWMEICMKWAKGNKTVLSPSAWKFGLRLSSWLFPRKHIKMVGSTLLLGNIVKLTCDWYCLVLHLDRETYKCQTGSHNFGPSWWLE